MELKLSDAARCFDVPEKTIYNWIETRKFPAAKVNGQFRFSREALLEWAAETGTRFSAQYLRDQDAAAPVLSLAESLTLGGVHFDIKGETPEAALTAATELLQVPESVDRGFLLQMLLAREALGSTGVGGGIAIPHPRNPIVLPVDRPLASLFFLERPIDFHALDGRPVDILFMLISPTVRIHLQVLSRLAYLLHDAPFKTLLTERRSAETLIARMRELESILTPGKPA